MHYLVITDIADPRRLRRAAKVCERWGERVQKSVYLMELDAENLLRLQSAMIKIMHGSEDSARYYALCGLDIGRSSGEGLGRGLKPMADHWIV
ncbi:CRISPR-associated endonuclease Cas2 [Nitrosomonas sp.]|uniref:CRISPR-associated endonuclease Cas2 n=1 Tax=Nitrosomonas sp. TaxID=42353 RepID=UPI001D7F7332|nr:CRISPR-associated endonuclease Cas2 [Nitrosomonas sp.]MCB1950312.1 CRISPR-associated endonuclease Cas2 [Nitrosomonas sp.]